MAPHSTSKHVRKSSLTSLSLCLARQSCAHAEQKPDPATGGCQQKHCSHGKDQHAGSSNEPLEYRGMLDARAVSTFCSPPFARYKIMRYLGSTPNGAELTMLFVPARIRSRARQKGWGPFSNWYKSRGGGADQVLAAPGLRPTIKFWKVESGTSIVRYKSERGVLDKSKISRGGSLF